MHEVINCEEQLGEHSALWILYRTPNNNGEKAGNIEQMTEWVRSMPEHVVLFLENNMDRFILGSHVTTIVITKDKPYRFLMQPKEKDAEVEEVVEGYWPVEKFLKTGMRLGSRRSNIPSKVPEFRGYIFNRVRKDPLFRNERGL